MLLYMDLLSRREKHFSFMFRPTILMLVFLMVLAPISSVLAEEAGAPAAEDTAPAPAKAEAVQPLPAPTPAPAPENNASQTNQAEPDSRLASPRLAAPSAEEMKRQSIEQGFCKNCNLLQSNGSLNYSYELELPQGRNGLMPKASLNYSQFNRDVSSIAGFGWDLNTGPYIERVSRFGADTIYSTNEFRLYADGGMIKLVSISLSDSSHGSYAAGADEAFPQYEFLKDNSWAMTDTKGVKYYFGQSAQSRQDDPNDAGRIYRWHIEKIQDTNGNVINYSYFKDKGRVYPKEIRWADTPGNAGIYSVRFEPFAGGALTERSDKSLSYNTGFKVETSYRLQNIAVGVYQGENFTAEKEYRLDFINRPNTKVYSLAGITEAGRNGADWDLKPKMDFGYDTAPNSWELDTKTKWNLSPETGQDIGWMSGGDINNDGLNDQFIFKKDYSHEVYLNNGIDGWHKTEGDWHIPAEINWRSLTFVNPPSQKVTYVDINGDQLDDIIVNDIYKNTFNVYLNNGFNGWDFNAGPWNNPQLAFGASQSDINNDGLVDYVEDHGPDVHWVYFNNGRNGWDRTGGTSWKLPNSGENYLGGDINNDGLPDMIWKTTEAINLNGEMIIGKAVYLYNNKDGWEKAYSNADKNPSNDFGWQIPDGIHNITGCNNYGRDLNNDNSGDFIVLPKPAQQNNCGRYSGIYAYNGISGWEKAEIGSPPSFIGEDYNNDGWTDYSSQDNIYLNTGTNTFFLNSIKNNRGGEVKIDYQNARSFRTGDGKLANPRLKWDKFAVKKISYLDSDEESQSSEFHYSGGEYILENADDPWSREFAGFHAIKTTDKAGNYTIEYFHQGGGADGSAKGEYQDHFSKKGKPYRIERYDKSDRLYDLQINKYDKDDLGNGRYFPKLASQASAQYDGDSDYRAVAKKYDYDSFGNIKQEIDFGEAVLTDDAGGFTDIGSDKVTSDYEYAGNAAKNIQALISGIKQSDASVKLIGRKVLYYDKLVNGQVDKGNLTKLETLIEQVNGRDRFKTEELEYNEYGLPVKAKNGRSFTTETVYDQNKIFPEKTVNAKSQITKYAYDLFYGQPTVITDPNGLQVKNILDGLGRPVEVKASNPSNPAEVLTKTAYKYNDAKFPNSVTQTDFTQNNGADIIKVNYMDGLGRTIQVRSEAEGDKFTVESLTYDELGNVKKKILPKFSAGIGFEAINPADLGEEYNYDALNRLTSAKNSLGTTAISYDQWRKTAVDAKNNKKDFKFDADENLVEVDEYLDGVSYATRYNYDGLNNLINIIDAKGNIRSFSYDLLGRRTAAEDSHAVTDRTFSVWRYQYDDNDNLTARVDGRSLAMSYTYDQLDRVLSEINNTGRSVEASYIYDSGQNSVGRLSQVNFGQGSKNYYYDVLGNTTRDDQSIYPVIPAQAGIQNLANPPRSFFTTFYAYDFLGNILNINLPGQSAVSYTYNNAGQVSGVKNGANSVASNISYEANGQIKNITYANGVNTTNTFDPAKLYRLINKKTVKGQTALQDISYTYDPVGNITDLVEASATKAARVARYGYDDLYRLTSAEIKLPAGSLISETYRYDILGNILHKSDVGNYSYNGNQGTNFANPHAATSVASSTYDYDRNGNLAAANGWKYNWDYNNRLTGALLGTTTKVRYGYDNEGERTYYTNGADTTVYANKYFNTESHVKTITTPITQCSPNYRPATWRRPGIGSCVTFNQTKTVTTYKNTKQIYLGDLLLATIETANGKDSIFYVHTDHLTGSNVVTNQTGAVAQVLDYYPFGGVRIDDKTGAFSEQKKFTGKELDKDTGLYYYGARYYNGGAGRFTSADAAAKVSPESFLADPQQLNSYAYARNNPLKYIDPDGLTMQDAVKGYGVGLALGVYSTVSYMFNIFWHPIDSAKDMGNQAAQGAKAWKDLATDLSAKPTETAQQIKDGVKISYNEFMDKPDYEKGKTIGKATEKVMEAAAAKKIGEGIEKGNIRETTLGADKGVQVGKYNIDVEKYNHGGGGLNIRDTSLSGKRTDQRILGVDYHSFKYNNEIKTLPHIDTKSTSHFPWNKLDKNITVNKK